MNSAADPRAVTVRAIDVFGNRLTAVQSEDLDVPTPCADWTVRDLVDHVVTEELWAAPLLAGGTTRADRRPLRRRPGR